jgi:hypothetical protein
MQSTNARGIRRRAAAVGAALLLIGGAAIASLALSRPHYEKRGYVHRVEEGDALYTYDAAWRIEALQGLGGPVALAPDPALLEHLRDVLLRRLGCRSLEQIPVEGKAEMDAIRALGYL